MSKVFEVPGVSEEKRMLSIVLASGGMDSCVTAAIDARESELALLHVSYGQRTAERELAAFNALADHFRAPRRLATSLTYLTQIGGSSLTDHSIAVSEADLAHLLAIATSWAEVIGAQRIYIGAVAEDSSGYPDCRPEFYHAFANLIRTGTRPETEIEIVTPIISLRKSQIIRRGVELDAPLQLTWSCYRRNDLACGTCDSCALRLRGFREAGLKDPISYASPTQAD